MNMIKVNMVDQKLGKLIVVTEFGTDDEREDLKASVMRAVAMTEQTIRNMKRSVVSIVHNDDIVDVVIR